MSKKAFLYFILLVIGTITPLAGSHEPLPRQERPIIGSKQSSGTLPSSLWNPQHSSVTNDLYSVTGIDNNLWIAGSDGALLTSTDEGTSWTAVESEFTGTWFSIAFINSSHGFVTGSTGTLTRSTDGGASWAFISTGVIVNLYTQTWLNSSHGWLAGENGVLLFTQDSGSSWTPHSVSSVNNLRAIAFFNNTHGWVAGTNGLIARTTDSGGSWTAVPVPVIADWIVLKILDENTVWVAGTGGNLLITTDAGTTWNKAPVETTGTITTITSFFSSNILIAGENGFCAITNSTGSTFTMQETSTTLTLQAGYYSSSASWLVGYNGLILYRLDTIPPAAINNLETRNPKPTSITLRWTAPGDDGPTGIATGYEVRYSPSNEITNATWDTATLFSQTWLPQSGGTTETHVITGLGSSKQYWFAIKAFDDRGNFGPISNSPSGTTKAQPSDGDGDGEPPPNQAPTVTLTFPNGGEVLIGEVTINWEASDPDGDQLKYTLSWWNGSTEAPWVLLAEQLGETSYLWDTTTVPDGFTYQVQVEADDSKGGTDTDESNAPFSIDNVNQSPEVQVLSPNGGEVWTGTQLIQWTGYDPDGYDLTYTIQYSLDDGVTWEILTTGLGTPYYEWDTTQVEDSSICLIRVVASDGVLTGADSSDAVFTIDNIEDITTTSPVPEFGVGGVLGVLALVGVVVGVLLPLSMIQRHLRK